MKKITIAIAIILVSVTTTFSQKTFQGTLEYKIEMSGGMAEMMAGMMPEKYIFEVLKSDYLLYMQGGLVSEMMGKVLYQDNTGEAFIIKDGDSTIYTIDLTQQATPQTTVTATDETKEILGYTCKKYNVISVVDDIATTQNVWANEKYLLPKVKNSQGLNMNSTFYFDGIKGMPMRTEIEVEGMVISMELINMETKKPSKTHFTLPKDYAVKPFDANTFMNGE
ncbi:MAG: DUF4412 domain-containing protein [Bacteroidetes bacterium]|nr:DUF4412 domain-containing protein [Bacteroidota bacterium]MBP7398554.1 DUF4412 domain-containing protein [Chitinophagales bacterium]MBK7109950.1 DUF4412 domain-containing protein [Bacteroidota bacterium]MBK8487324.1 DUF4412 domain-containing protein [Bacteroidota bacterium]MBK8682937.1 DUF4412 domain-containing protein [Bacteroidota bacterium]